MPPAAHVLSTPPATRQEHLNSPSSSDGAAEVASPAVNAREKRSYRLPVSPHSLDPDEPQRCRSAAAAVSEAHRLAAIVLTATAAVTSLGSIAIAAVVLHHCNTRAPKGDSGYLYVMVSFILYMVVMIESAICFVAMVVCFSLLLTRPHRVLLPRRSGCGFVCLTITVVLLLLLAAYSVATPILLRCLDQLPRESPALCIVPAARLLALLTFLVVLVYPRPP